MATTREMIWQSSFLYDLGIMTLLMCMNCDNKIDILISRNFAFHERTKNIEINYHVVHEKVLELFENHVPSSDWFSNIFTKSLIGVSYDS